MGPIEKELSVFRMIDSEFRRDVLGKLGRLETKMDSLAGNGQPGRMKDAENKIAALEQSDVRRSVYDRAINAAISVAVSLAIATHEKWKIW
jgi:hypothetical protein